MQLNDITFCAFDLGINAQTKITITNEVLATPNEMWYYDSFRGCHMLPIYNSGGLKNNIAKGELIYTEAGAMCPTLQNILENKIFKWMCPEGRVTILKTPPGFGLNEHLDSQAEEVGTLQHKFRIALTGEIDRLYFINSRYEKVYVPDCYDTYILDGSHPHGLEPGDTQKLTLCIGAPWTGNPTPEYVDIIENKYLHRMFVPRPELKEEWTNPRWK